MAFSVVIDEVSNNSDPFEVIFIPWFATGHLIPLTDIAIMFASRNISSTILTTPANAALIQPTITHLSSSFPIQNLLYPFPSSLSNLPPNAENIASVPSSESPKFDIASIHSRPAIESLLRLRRPNVLVADIHFTWIFETAAQLHMPFLDFYPVGLFPIVVMHALKIPRDENDSDITDDDDDNDHDSSDDDVPFLVPGLPHDIHMVKSELPFFFETDDPEENIWSKLKEMEAKSCGLIVNSYSDIESDYVDCVLKFRDSLVWFIGPVALATTTTYNQKELVAVRGGENDINWSRCSTWLDSHSAKSVVYICFGSWCHFSADQIRELALGLASCGHPFLWVVRDASVGFLPQGYEDRVEVEGKGLVVRGWVPQSKVLEHVSVGGFMTHCGWNSLLEGLTAGLPMVTWPLVFEQFINEKLLTNVLRVGVKCRKGNGSTREDEKEVVRAADVAIAIGRIMNAEEGAEMRRRSEEYAVKAKVAVNKGGSSYNAVNYLIKELRAWPKRT